MLYHRGTRDGCTDYEIPTFDGPRRLGLRICALLHVGRYRVCTGTDVLHPHHLTHLRYLKT